MTVLRDRPLRVQMIAIILAVSVLGLMVAGTTLFLSERSRGRSELIGELVSLAKLLGDRSSAALVFLDDKTGQENLLALAHLEQIGSACLFTAQGTVFATFAHGEAAVACRPLVAVGEQAELVEDDTVRVQMPVHAGDELVGAIRIDSTAAPLAKRTLAQAVSLALALGGALGLAVLLTLRLQRVITTPLAQIRDVANAIVGSNDVSLRAPALGDNELGELAVAFNRMLETIAAQNAALAELNRELENRVAQRTGELVSANQALASSIDELRHTQSELVQREKMASLGVLVAGVAHELNTPLGNSLTVASTLRDDLNAFDSDCQSGTLRKARLAAYVDHARHGLELLLRNLERAVDQVTHFKQASVDQTSDQRRRFRLDTTVADVVAMVQPQFKKTPHRVVVAVPPDIVMDSFPGALGQVVTNLVLNSLVHGFSHERPGEVRVRAQADGNGELQIEVVDNGRGIPTQNLSRVFDPFFTTRLGQGGSGLGLNIVYNIVANTLGGSIAVESEPGHRTCFRLQLPLVAPQVATVAALP